MIEGGVKRVLAMHTGKHLRVNFSRAEVVTHVGTDQDLLQLVAVASDPRDGRHGARGSRQTERSASRRAREFVAIQLLRVVAADTESPLAERFSGGEVKMSPLW